MLKRIKLLFSSRKYGYLAKNTLFFSIGVFGAKILNFFLVPFYTNMLDNSEYGVIDLVTTTSSLLFYAVTLCLGDAVFLYVIQDSDNKEEYFNIGKTQVFIGSGVVIPIIFLLKIFGIIHISKHILMFLCIHLFLSSLVSVYNYYLQATEKVKYVAISGIILTAVTVVSNLFFLLVLNMGLKGYFISSVLGLLSSTIFSGAMCKKVHYTVRHFFHGRKIYKEMLIYSFPLVINGLAWWINGSIDRYFIAGISGVSFNGIYSAASTIPNILTMVSTVILQAWAISAIKEYDKDDKDGFLGNVYSTCNFLFGLMCSVILIFNKFVTEIFLPESYVSAWRSSIWLTVAVVFSIMSSFVGSIFSAAKDNRAYAVSTIVAAIVNIVLNAVLIPFLDEVGAAIATMVSFFVVWLIRYFISKKYISWNNNMVRDLIAYVIIVIQAICVYMCRFKLFNLGVIIIMFVLYKDVIIKFRLVDQSSN